MRLLKSLVAVVLVLQSDCEELKLGAGQGYLLPAIRLQSDCEELKLGQPVFFFHTA